MSISPNAISRSLSNRIASAIPEHTHDVDRIRYGLEWFLSGCYQTALLFLIAYPFGLIQESVVCLVTGAILRMISGGTHLSGYFRCLSMGTLLIIGFSYTSTILAELVGHPILLILLSVPFTVVGLMKNAPKLYRKSHLFTKRQLKQFKMKAIFMATTMLLVLIVLPLTGSSMVSGCFGILFQVFTLTKTGEKAILSIDHKLTTITHLTS